MSDFKRVYIDIETAPNIVYSWNVGYKLSIDYSNIIQERAIICVSYKYHDESEVHSLWWNKGNDKKLVEKVFKILCEADEIVTHNGNKFDLPWLRTRALFHNVKHEVHGHLIDTCRLARSKYYFNSNKLDYIAKFLMGEEKLSHDGFKMWTDIMNGNREQLKKMVKYCEKDVLLLEKIYDRIKNEQKPPTHIGVTMYRERWTCPACGSESVHKNKTRVTAAGMMRYEMRCKDCRKSYSIPQKAHNDYLTRFDREINTKEQKIERRNNKRAK